jgi:DNA-binding IscR family transcriptional regulator
MQNALADLAESHKQLAGTQKQLAESQKMTEERLRTVLTALERGFGGNGRGRKTS